MPYRKEIFVENAFYHIILRRIDEQVLFKSDRDRIRFLFSALLINTLEPPTPHNISEWKTERMLGALINIKELPEEWVKRKREIPLVRICSFILMKTHVHFFLEQLTENGIQKFIQQLGDSYGKFFNIKYNRKGPLFETPFKAVPIINNRQLRYIVGYIALNALDTAGIEWRRMRLKDSWDSAKKVLISYPWSSTNYFMGQQVFGALIDGGLVKKLFPTPRSFEKHLREWQISDNGFI